MIFSKKNISLCVTFIAAFSVSYIFRNDIFMWDNITTCAATSSYFFYNGWHIFSMGNFLDIGHPPTMSLYYATVWKLFGRNLIVSHFAQMPFLWLLLQQLFLIGDKLFSGAKKIVFIAASFILVFADTTFLSQVGQVGFEIPSVALWLLAVNLLWKRYAGNYQKINALFFFFTLCIVFIPLIHLRGLALTISLFVAEAFFQFQNIKNNWKKIGFILIPYLISATIFCIWLWFHFTNVGYLFSDAKSSWGAANMGIADMQRAIYNSFLVLMRWLDNGRILMCLAMFLAAFFFVSKFKNEEKSFAKFIFLIFISASFCLSLNFVVMTKYVCHRYFLPSIIMMPMLIVYFISEIKFLKSFFVKIIFLAILFDAAIAGNFIFYFERYSIGWDSTLAHLPYQDLRAKAIRFADENKIPALECGSRFPFDVADSLIYLKQNSTQKPPWQTSSMNASNLTDFNFVLYSNVCTSFTDEQNQILQQHYQVIKEWKNVKVEVKFFEKKIKIQQCPHQKLKAETVVPCRLQCMV